MPARLTYTRVRGDQLVDVWHDPDRVAEEKYEGDVDGDAGEENLPPAQQRRLVSSWRRRR
jgi:hypothetical protein